MKDAYTPWPRQPLGRHVRIISGKSPSFYKLETSGRFPFIRVEDLNNCAKYQQLSRTYTDDAQNAVPRHSVIFPKRGAAIMTNKVRIAKVPLQMDTNMMALVPRGDIEPEFLYYTLLYEELFRIADTSTIPQINNKHINPYEVPIPPRREQQHIVEVLRTWDIAQEQLRNLLASKRERKRGLMQVLLTGKKRFTQYAHLARRSAPLADYVASARKGKPLSLNDAGRGVPYIGSAAFDGDYTSHTDDPSAVNCSAKDVLLLWDGEYAGKSTTGHVGAVGSTVVAITLKPGLDHVYLHNLLLFHNQRIRSIREGSGIPHMPGDFFTWFKPHLPPIEEQRTIASVFSTADRELRKLEAQLEAYKLQMRGLMQQLLTGNKRVNVNVPETVPA